MGFEQIVFVDYPCTCTHYVIKIRKDGKTFYYGKGGSLVDLFSDAQIMNKYKAFSVKKALSEYYLDVTFLKKTVVYRNIPEPEPTVNYKVTKYYYIKIRKDGKTFYYGKGGALVDERSAVGFKNEEDALKIREALREKYSEVLVLPTTKKFNT